MTTHPAPAILYAEDDENDVFFMERAFSKLKMRDALHVVPNGRTAIEYLDGAGAFANRTESPLPGIVLLDVKMPEMSGLEVLKWARERVAFRALPIVMFTSSTQRSDIEFSRAHGATAYLVKPSNSENLASVVTKIMTACAGWVPGGPALTIDGNQLEAD
jgi:CheY-like chemotaxis protein